MTAATKTVKTELTIGDWVEISKTRKGRSYLPVGSRWVIESVNIDREMVKVGNGKTGELYKFEHLHFDEIIPSVRFKKGDVVQHDEDPRYIGHIVKETTPGQKDTEVKWATGPKKYVPLSLLSLFARMVKGNQQILREYAFKVGDRVTTVEKNHQGKIFTVRNCYSSGIVGLTSELDHQEISLPGCWLTIVESESSTESEAEIMEGAIMDEFNPESVDVSAETIETSLENISIDANNQSTASIDAKAETNILLTDPAHLIEEGGQFSIFQENDEPPDPDDFPTTAEYYKALDIWKVKFPELAAAVKLKNEEIQSLKTAWENFPTPETLDWVDPANVDLTVGTQTRTSENNGQIAIYSEKMQTNEWDWQREPLPELVKDGEIYYVVSGHHRVKAALLASKPDEDTEAEPVMLFCRIIHGTLDDAKLLAIRSNANDYHGVPESRADFRNRVNKFFSLLDSWDAKTQTRELEQLKLQPYASEQAIAIDQLLIKIQQGTAEGWSNRVIATYLQSPRSYRTIGNLLNVRQTEGLFNSVKSGLTYGDWIQFENEGETQAGRISYLSTTTISVIGLDKSYLNINNASPLDLLKSITRVEPITETEQAGQTENTPPPKKSSSGGSGGGGHSSVSRDGDREQNTSPHDVDDRPFASPSPTPEQIRNECLIGFISNSKEMTQPMIRKALESILDWMEVNDKTENLDCLKTIINDL